MQHVLAVDYVPGKMEIMVPTVVNHPAVLQQHAVIQVVRWTVICGRVVKLFLVVVNNQKSVAVYLMILV